MIGRYPAQITRGLIIFPENRKWAPTHNTGEKGRMSLPATPPKMAKIDTRSCSPAPPSGAADGEEKGAGSRVWT